MNHFKKTALILVFLFQMNRVFAQHQATVREYKKTFTTYPFSDPDPVPNTGKIYPYFRYDGFTDQPVRKQWKVVALENDYLKVLVTPEIGGKIWTAIDKANGKPFVYNNPVVKFRDVGMRGPWTSGGIEANFGILGHTPGVATPVDYLTRVNEDGSASCIISTLDLLTGTRWNLEIRLPKDKAYFITRVYWHNATPVQQSYYSWMNLAEKVSDSLVYIDPGNHYIGHDGSVHSWPLDTADHRNISVYDQNNFGPSKSYHVLGTYASYFGAYWQKEDYGMIHLAERGDKLGKKVWIWSLSGQGMIWKDQLTDHGGQYTELQSGRLFSQNALASSLTPFKQAAFAPYQSDRWTEYWYPFSRTGGVSDAGVNGVAHLQRRGDSLVLAFSAVAPVNDTLRLINGRGRVVFQERLQLKPLQTYHRTIPWQNRGDSVVLHVAGDSSGLDPLRGRSLDRPLTPFRDFDWQSGYGRYLMGRDEALYHDYEAAEASIRSSLQEDPAFIPALTEMSILQYRRMQYDSAFYFARMALSVDTYDPAANYYYGLAAAQLGKWYDALDGFEVASLGSSYRSAAFTEMSRVYLRQGNDALGYEYASRSVHSDPDNVTACQLQYLAARLTGDQPVEEKIARHILRLEPLNPFIRFEAYLQHRDPGTRSAFTGAIRNELPVETYLSLAIWYHDLGRYEESKAVLEMAPASNLVAYWLAFLYRDDPRGASLLRAADQGDPRMVFPFRSETAGVMRWAMGKTRNWKPRYYLALVEAGRNNKREAAGLLDSGDTGVGFAPFFIVRAGLYDSLEADKKFRDLSRAVALDSNQWRYRKYLAGYLISRGESKKALQAVESYAKSHPRNYMIGLLVTRCLMLNNRYPEADSTLEGLHVLPYEGTTTGRQLYEQTKLMLALSALENGKFDQALAKVKEAETWPPRLGVGKPYPELIDHRKEDTMRRLIREARIQKASNRKDYTPYRKMIESIATHPRDPHAG